MTDTHLLDMGVYEHSPEGPIAEESQKHQHPDPGLLQAPPDGAKLHLLPILPQYVVRLPHSLILYLVTTAHS